MLKKINHKLIAIFMIFILIMNMFPLGYASTVFAEDENEEETEEIESDPGMGNQNILGSDVNNDDIKMFDSIVNNLRYDRDLHLELTKIILKNGAQFKNNEYADLFHAGKEIETASGTKFIGNGKLRSLYMPGDIEPEEGAEQSKGLFKMPLYDAKKERTLQVDDFINLKGWSGKVGGEQHVGKNLRSISIISNMNHYAENDSHGSQGAYIPKSQIIMKMYQQKEDTISQRYDVVLFDSYGNVVTDTGDVLVPYWFNVAISEFKDDEADMLENGRYIMSHPILGSKDFNYGKGTMKSIVEDSREYRSYISDSGVIDKSIPFDVVVNSSKKGEMREKLNGIYNEEDYLDALAEYIVDISEEEVRRYNENMIATIEDAINTGDTDSYAYVTNNTINNTNPTADQELEGVRNADNLIELIFEVFEVGLFRLLHLTVAGFVTNFYQATTFNHSMSEIFNTTLLSESVFWKNLVNTILILTIAFASVYLFLLLIRMFTGHIKIKDIVVRLIILAMAVVTPIIGYSPAVNLLFNKPASAILNDEMSKMFVLDLALEEHEVLAERWKEEMPKFFMDYTTRQRSEDYIIQFYTNKHVDGYNINTPEGLELAGSLKESDIEVLNVSAFHVFEWLRTDYEDGDIDGTLFDYLRTNYYTEYYGLDTTYEEFAFDSTFELLGEEKPGKRITASELLAEIYVNMMENTDSLGDDFYDLGTELFIKTDYDENYVKSIKFDLTSTSFQRQDVYQNDGSISEETRELLDKLNIENGDNRVDDFLNIRSIIDELRAFTLYESEIDTNVKNINEKVFNKYMSTYLELRDKAIVDDAFVNAEMNVLALNILFETTKELDIELFPTAISSKGITLDTYIRSLYIPIEEIRYDNIGVENIASYVASKDDITSTIVFFLTLLALVSYGIVKWVVLYWILMPLILIMFFYNFVLINNKKSKVWIGALGILLTFAAVNGGLILLWKLLIFVMNSVNSNANVVGISHYPIILWHSILVILYIILAFKYLLVPLYRNVKGDISNLGGTKMADGALRVFGNMKSSLGKFWDSMSNVKSNFKDGINPFKSNSKGKDASKTDDDKGKAGKMNNESVKNSKSKEENEKDKKEAQTVTNKLKTAGKNAVKNRFNNSKLGQGINNLKKKREALMGISGLEEVRSLMKSNPDDKRGIFEKLKDAKDAAGRHWLDASDSWDSEKTQEKMKRAEDLINAGEKLDAVPDLEKLKDKNLTEEDMKELEEMGLDTEINETKSFKGENPVILDIEDDFTRNMVEDNLKKKGYKFDTKDNKIILGMDQEEYADERVRKDMFGDLVTKSEQRIAELKGKGIDRKLSGNGLLANKLGDNTYSLANNEALMPVVEKRLSSFIKQGIDVRTETNEDGELLLHFTNESDANTVLGDIERKTSAFAKAKGLAQTSSFDIRSEADYTSFKGMLDEAGISYDLDTSGGSYNLQIQGGSGVFEEAESILNSSDYLSSRINTISGEHETVENNEVLRRLVEERVSSGELELGKDVVINGNDVSAISTNAKRYLNNVGRDYSEKVNETVGNLVDVAYNSASEVFGEGGGFNVTVHEKGIDSELDSFIVTSDIYSETYDIDNRSFDPNEFKKIVEEANRKAFKAKKVNEPIINQVNAYENSNRDIIKVAQDFNNVGRTVLDKEGNLNEEVLNKAVDLLSGINQDYVNSIQELMNSNSMKSQDIAKGIKETLDKAYEETGNKKVYDEYQSYKTRKLNAQKAIQNSINTVEKKLMDSYVKVKANGLEFERTNDNRLQVHSSIQGQQDLVTDILKTFNNYKNTPKPNPGSNANGKPVGSNRPGGPGPGGRAGGPRPGGPRPGGSRPGGNVEIPENPS